MKSWWFTVWVVVEALLVLSSVALWAVATEHTVLNISVSIFTILLGVLLFYPRRVDIVTFVKSRQGKNAFSHLMSFFLLVCIAGLVSYLSWKFQFKKDMTERDLNTLSAQSQKILHAMPEQTKLTLYARRANWPGAMALLKLYRDVRPDLTIDAVDPELHPQKARAAGVQDEGTVVIESRGKRVSFVLDDELSITNAFLKFVREKSIKVYLTWGHGEATCENTGAEGISSFCQHLKQQQYQVEKLDLQTTSEVPTDAELVIVWGPTGGFLPQEVQRLQRWLEKGGSLLVLYSPQFQVDPMVELRELISKWGIKANNDLVVDRVSTLETQEATIPLISQYANHPVTRGFKARTIFPLSSSLEPGEPLYQGVAVTPLAATSAYPGSWAERDLKGISQGHADYTEGVDRKGPVAIVAVAERLTNTPGEKDTRVGVIGNDVFTRNAYQNQTANMNLLLNMVGWLVHDEGLVSLNRPGLSHEPVILSAIHLRMIFVVTVIAVPLTAFVLALLVYRRRRKL